MKTFISIFFLFLISRKQEDSLKNDYYIISKQDSIQKVDEQKVPPPTIPKYLKFYSNTVFILDDKNVYIYQTDTIRKFHNKAIDFNYPDYLGLKPENLLSIKAENLKSFIENNKDIFVMPDKNSKRYAFFYIASTNDTIKNVGFYDLTSIAGKKVHTYYVTRKLTEEESIVLKYKKNGLPFLPEKINWTRHFLNGNVKPFTVGFDELKKSTNVTRKVNTKLKDISDLELITM